MQSPTHFVVGAAICRYTKWRPLGLLLAFDSHFVLDALPHFEDPSILPGRMSHIVAGLWLWILLGAVAMLAPLGWMVWRRFGGESGGMRVPAYLIAGGLLACFPDYLTEMLGRDMLIGYWNSQCHQTWCPTYYELLRTSWRPWMAPGCLISEAAVFAAGFWSLFCHNLVKSS